MENAHNSVESNAAVETLDHETRATDRDHEALRVWLRMLTCTNIVESQLRTRLRQSFDSTLPRFDLMAQLDRHPDGLKMSELSRRLMVTGGNVTGLTDKLVQEGLVVRQDDPRDRRSFTVRLTPEGKAQFRRMAGPHEQWVVELFAGLDHGEKVQLLKLLDRLKKHLGTLSV
ncbi:MAG: MarR family transcriptional regulator [Aromatoleum sp.]|jgi:DNA-binding MarR family transcriptional regulator|uniref:MarR family winged helix-turn-helix transcriptional regulator n=1 Tax=Aromatoleum sp. TaxID=2307007 RepID=UPI002895F3B7|nr:MarR family transcriptional regulator [Aromatoleum sp.]MDT3669447.1 MarR family transcriptional regulator [Aromatoleum sp.]